MLLLSFPGLTKEATPKSKRKIAPKFIVLHCIGFDEKKALKLLKPISKKPGPSAHYLIPQVTTEESEESHPIYKIVPDNHEARHAGMSKWKGIPSLNHHSIGIEFHSPNYARALEVQAGQREEPDWSHFDQFSDEQIEAGIKLIRNLMKKYNIKPENVVGHSDIAPYREDSNKNIILGKTDPGTTFPWKKLAKSGIGVWPKSHRTRSGDLDTSVKNAQKLLSTYGYSVPTTGNLDLKTQFVIKAFQMHFMPEKCDGKISAEMIIYLENLIDHQFDL
jgi:N-acetylmuramoyl-L-alanine amidase